MDPDTDGFRTDHSSARASQTDSSLRAIPTVPGDTVYEASGIRIALGHTRIMCGEHALVHFLPGLPDSLGPDSTASGLPQAPIS